MSATVSTDFLLRVAQATPEQQAAIERFLDGKADIGKVESRNEMGVREMVAGIYREIASVRKDFSELKSAKQRLEKMLADGVFAFTRKVDATSFKVLCTILAEGDVSKASRTLGMPDPSIRTLMRRWREGGKEYRAMLELIQWRKKVGRKETVPLNQAILHDRVETTDYPGLVADVLEKVTEITGENWAEKAEELEEMLRLAVR